MPVVELNLTRLQKLIGPKADKKKIKESLPFLGLDIESENGYEIRVEYSPNRPDYSTDFGIAIGLEGLLGIKKGEEKLRINQKSNYLIKVDPTLLKIRPYVTGIVAKNGTMDDDTIQQFMVMQEDLHLGIGRKRIKSSIGLHDLDNISFPLKYTTVRRNHKFVPLHYTENLSIEEILEKTEVGKNYASILGSSPSVPIILDAKRNTISFPPIINSELTAVTTKTKNILVEITGMTKSDVESMLAIVSVILQKAGFHLYTVKVSGAKNSTPKLKSKNMTINSQLVNQTLGLKISPANIVSYLKKCRLNATVKNKKIICSVPPYRFDMLGPMDIVEEVALGYGIQNLTPTLSPSQTLGQGSDISSTLQKLSLTMIGLGYMEALNSSLTSKNVLYDSTGRDPTGLISVLGSKSQEYTILRNAILPGLLENLSKNIHETYPQKLFETGIVFLNNGKVDEEVHLAALSAYKDANFTEGKSILHSCLSNFGFSLETKASDDPIFEAGRSAKVIINKKELGSIGEINSKIIDHYKIRTPAVGFEIKLSGLIFD